MAKVAHISEVRSPVTQLVRSKTDGDLVPQVPAQGSAHHSTKSIIAPNPPTPHWVYMKNKNYMGTEANQFVSIL